MTEMRYAHGTKAAYVVDGCRCKPCGRAYWRYEQRRRYDAAQGNPLTVPALGYRRRVEALMAIGWSQKVIGEHLGGVSQQVISARCFRAKRVTRQAHQEMVELYDELSGKFPPETPKTAWLRTYAKNRGYAPPLAWDDIDTDEHPVGLPGNERLDKLRAGELEACSIQGCDNLSTRRGWCVKHYRRWCRHGDPLKASA